MIDGERCHNCGSRPDESGRLGCYACWPDVIEELQGKIERLRAEAKLKDRALLSAKYDAERVEYYKNILCVDNGKWVCLPRTGAAATAIDPEKLEDILEERESLRAELDSCQECNRDLLNTMSKERMLQENNSLEEKLRIANTNLALRDKRIEELERVVAVSEKFLRNQGACDE